jgi:8-oxo-dGTP pyrophosphatase MutT (NUDIX family)
VVTPAPASTVLLLRDGTDGPEVLMGRRRSDLAFGGAWVFPGGAVEEIDHDEDLTRTAGLEDGPWRAAAARETAEEVGIFLTVDPVVVNASLQGVQVYRHVSSSGTRFAYEALRYVSNWVTPEGAPRRFDTRFFVAEAPFGSSVGALADEFDEAEWVRPGAALREYAAGSRRMILPTVAHLDFLRPFAQVADALAGADAADVRRVEPRIVRRNGVLEVEVPSPGPAP